MDSFEGALNKAKEMASAAYKKTEEAIIIQKQKLELVSLNTKLNDAFSSLGKALYNKDIDLSGEEEIVNEIKALEEQIAALNSEIRKAKCKDNCVVCGKEIEKDAAFCSHCGAKQED